MGEKRETGGGNSELRVQKSECGEVEAGGGMLAGKSGAGDREPEGLEGARVAPEGWGSIEGSRQAVTGGSFLDKERLREAGGAGKLG